MLRSLISLGIFSLIAISCGGSSAPPVSAQPSPRAQPAPRPERTPLVSESHPLYARLEAPFANNDCQADVDCLSSGCASEVCSADGVVTHCAADEGPLPVQSASCGCVEGQCRWFALTAPSMRGEPDTLAAQ